MDQQLTIQIKIKNVYGRETVYPNCDKSKLFAQLKGQKTLTYQDLKIIRDLGYSIETTVEPLSF